jgi:hypothetical protein
MAFDLSEFARLRPFAYHLTSRINADALRRTRRLRTAASLLNSANRLDLLRTRRAGYIEIETPDGNVVLKDQRPLIEANTSLPPEWEFGDLVQFLNGFVFFWPGSNAGPIGPGRRLLDRYQGDDSVILRVGTEELFAENGDATPEFCPFNSGAPRFHAGRAAPRGPELFTGASQFPRRASEVVELGFRGDVALPPGTEYRAGSEWVGFFDLLSNER